jgi:predicted GNAT family acetyltransferase
MREIEVTMNEKASRFETKVSEDVGFLNYRLSGNNMDFMYIFVPEAARGKGYAVALAKFAFDYAKAKNLKITVYCSYLAKYLRQHPEYADLVDKK